MKKVVFLEGLKESEIRPDVLYDKYKDMLKDELSTLFNDQSQFIQIDCPGCCGNKYEKTFEKFGFQYCRCGDCGSLFVSPRPTAEMLDIFRKDSQAVRFWSNEIA
ncbi:MAG: hypothetical protein GY861_10550, partial [bacterium]|nr:hypothetical protein [bacterium]